MRGQDWPGETPAALGSLQSSPHRERGTDQAGRAGGGAGGEICPLSKNTTSSEKVPKWPGEEIDTLGDTQTRGPPLSIRGPSGSRWYIQGSPFKGAVCRSTRRLMGTMARCHSPAHVMG